jgi:hypothetical protein
MEILTNRREHICCRLVMKCLIELTAGRGGTRYSLGASPPNCHWRTRDVT